MTLKHSLKMLARQFGLDVMRYNAVESAEARLLRQLQRHEIDLVIDVGANDGGYARSLREVGYRGRILSFEPLSEAHARLSAASAADPLWQVAPRMALSDTNGQTQIHIAGNSTSSSLLPMSELHARAAPSSRYQGSEITPVGRLEDLRLPELDTTRRPFLKVDTQGHELPVLRGCGQALERMVGVQVELSVVALYEGQETYLGVLEFLQARGFDLWNVLPGFVDPHSGRMLQFDGVFFRP